MLKITVEQLRRLRDDAASRFEDVMVEHARAFAPKLFEVIAAGQMRVAVARALTSGRAHGFTFRGPLRLYVELVLLYGSGFDDDPQYPALRAILDSPDDQMVRAQRLVDHITAFQIEVAGPDARNVFQALRYLADLARGPERYDLTNLDRQLLRDLTIGFEEKAAYVTEPNLRRLIALGQEEARRHGFETARQLALIPILMFAFGHRCVDDPLYPWIRRTLTDPGIVDAAARARRLERKAITWLDHVLAGQAST